MTNDVEPRGCPTPGACSALMEIAKLRSALHEIAKQRYGLDPSDTAWDQVEYWSTVAINYRAMAMEALSDDR